MDSGSSCAPVGRGQVWQGGSAVAAVFVIALLISAVFAFVTLGGGGTMPQAAFARPIITPCCDAEGNVDSQLQLTAEDRQVLATGWVQCSPVDGDYRLRAHIEQGDASGDGYRVGHCTGSREDWHVRVPAKGHERFTEGPATACVFLAPIGSDARKRVEESFHWCSDVQLSRTP